MILFTVPSPLVAEMECSPKSWLSLPRVVSEIPSLAARGGTLQHPIDDGADVGIIRVARDRRPLTCEVC